MEKQDNEQTIALMQEVGSGETISASLKEVENALTMAVTAPDNDTIGLDTITKVCAGIATKNEILQVCAATYSALYSLALEKLSLKNETLSKGVFIDMWLRNITTEIAEVLAKKNNQKGRTVIESITGQDIKDAIDGYETHVGNHTLTLAEYFPARINLLHNATKNTEPDTQLELFELSPQCDNDSTLVKIPVHTHRERKTTVQSNGQGQLFPILIQALKKSTKTYLNDGLWRVMGGKTIEHMRKEYAAYMNVKVMPNKTFAQNLDDLGNWYKTLKGHDLAMWMRIMGIAQSIKDAQKNGELVDAYEVRPGVFQIYMDYSKDFYGWLSNPIGGKTNGKPYFTSIQKKQLDKWLGEHQASLIIPEVVFNRQGQENLVFAPHFIYQIKTSVNTAIGKTISVLEIDTNIIETLLEEVPYGMIGDEELDAADTTWEQYFIDHNLTTEYNDYRLASFSDLPLRLLITLKQIYNRNGDFTPTVKGKDGNNKTLICNRQKLSLQELDKHLGNLADRVKTHAKKTHRAKKAEEIYSSLLNVTFDIGVKQKWLTDIPQHDDENWYIHFKRGYFDPKDTREKLTDMRKKS